MSSQTIKKDNKKYYLKEKFIKRKDKENKILVVQETKGFYY